MGKIALVFSGQGSQYSGMGKSLYDCSEAAKNLYDAAEKIRPGTKNQSFAGTADELKLTVNTQPCLYLVDLAAALALKENGITADMTAGFSLGEIAALAYSGAYTHEDGFRIVEKRGLYMQDDSAKHDTGMVAVLRASTETVESVCEKYDDVYPVNYNCPGQIVVAGIKDKLEQFKEEMTNLSCKCVELAVSGAFHSPFMSDASQRFSKELETYNINVPKIGVYANATAAPYTEDIKQLMAKQIISPVRWEKTVNNMIADGADTFIEVGAGRTLSGLIKKISKNVKVYNVEDSATLNAVTEAVKGNA